MEKTKKKSEWDAVAEKWNTAAGETGVWHQQHDIDPVILNMLGKVGGKRVLEVGCGNGYFSRVLAKKGAKVTAVDLSSRLIKLAMGQEKSKPLGITYLVRDAANLKDLKANSYDAVVANMSLMDIANAERAVGEAARVLRKNGLFVFSITHPIFSDFHWSVMTDKKKRHFGKFIYRYLQPFAEKDTLSIAGVLANLTGYHRPIETYIRYLRKAGLWLDKFREVATKKKVTKATKEDGDVTLRRSKYRILAEKKLKEVAGREIPLFLTASAVKK